MSVSAMVKDLYNPFEKYGIRRVINAATSATNLGGSIPDPEVFRAMEDSSKSFVVITELQAWAGRKIAEATGAEAGLPVASACNGLTLAAAACIMKGTELEEYDPLSQGRWSHVSMRLPMHTEGLRTEFIVQRECRNAYDHSVECAGGRFVEVDSTKEVLDAAQDYVLGRKGLRTNTLVKEYNLIRSLFMHNRADLPLDNSFRIRGDKPPVKKINLRRR